MLQLFVFFYQNLVTRVCITKLDTVRKRQINVRVTRFTVTISTPYGKTVVKKMAKVVHLRNIVLVVRLINVKH